MSAKKRALSRGSAMVEAVVSVPTLIVLFAGLVFTWQLYREKGRVTDQARLHAWAYAGSNCGEPGDPGVSGSEGRHVSGSAGAWSMPGGGAASGSGIARGSMDNGNNGDVSGNRVDLSGAKAVTQGSGAAGHTDMLSKNFGTASVTAQGAVAASHFLGGFTSPVGAERSVMCNEPPYNASLTHLIPAAFHSLTSW